MVEYLEDYKRLLLRGVIVFDELITLYAPDTRVDRDWAAITLMQIHNQRNSLAERLAVPPTKMTAEETSSVTVSIGHYLDSHWADYQELPTANSEKRLRVEQLHAELEVILAEMAPIHNAIR